MRACLALTLTLASVLGPSAAMAQLDDAALEGAADPSAEGDDLGVALSADQRAQLSLGGMRQYLERIREPDDDGLYALLDPRLDALEEREVAADVVFWTGTALGVAAVAAGIGVFAEYQGQGLADLGLGLMIGGASAFVLGLIIQAILRPGHDDLLRLIDLHDEHLGRR